MLITPLNVPPTHENTGPSMDAQDFLVREFNAALRLWSDADPGLEVKWPLVMHICSCEVSSPCSVVTTAAKAQSLMELNSEMMQNGIHNHVVW